MLAGESDLVESIAYLRQYCASVGRQQEPQIVLSSVTRPGAKLDAPAIVDLLGRYREMGVRGAAACCQSWTEPSFGGSATSRGVELRNSTR